MAEYVSDKWHVTLNDNDDQDDNGYWLQYQCVDDYVGSSSVGTQYPYRYKPGDHRQTDDLIQFGDYTDSIPYFRITGINRTYDGTPGGLEYPETTWDPENNVHCPSNKTRPFGWYPYAYFTCPLEHTLQMTWEGSVPTTIVNEIIFPSGADLDLDSPGYVDLTGIALSYSGSAYVNESAAITGSASGSSSITVTYHLPPDRIVLESDRRITEFFGMSVGPDLT
jgi:hypothetical protein